MQLRFSPLRSSWSPPTSIGCNSTSNALAGRAIILLSKARTNGDCWVITAANARAVGPVAVTPPNTNTITGPIKPDDLGLVRHVHTKIRDHSITNVARDHQ
jgi:hypothetical protein